MFDILELFLPGVFVQCAVTALTWGHNDKRLFVATGTQVNNVNIIRQIYV